MPSPSRVAWMMKAFPPRANLALVPSTGSIGRGDHQPFRYSSPLPARLPWPPVHTVSSALLSLLHSLFISFWAEPRHSAKKTMAKDRHSSGDTERHTGCVVSLESLLLSFSFVTMQCLSPHHRATTIADGEREDLPPGTTSARGHSSSGQRHPQEHTHTPPRKQFTVSDLSVSSNIGW